MIRVRVDDGVLVEKLRRMVQATPQARREGLTIMVRAVMEQVVARAPRDTGAFANAWAGAAISAGLGNFAVLPLNERSKLARRTAWLRSGVAYWTRIVQSNRDHNRTGKWPEDAALKLEAAKAELARMVTANPGRVDTSSTAIVPAGGTVRLYEHGGYGQFIQSANRSYYRLVNREPHARGVEGRSHVMRDAREPFRQLGLRGAGSRAFIARVAIASGLASALPTRR